MSSAGTLLSDLDTKQPLSGRDDDLVNQILNDMNSTNQPTMSQQLPSPQVSSYKLQQPNSTSTYQMATDPSLPTAHIIGRDQPTASDFTQMMMNSNPYQQNQGQQYLQQPQVRNTPLQDNSISWKTTIFDEIRLPLLVTFIVFIISLPALNVLFQHYTPTLVGAGGGLNNMGLLVRAIMAGGLLWISQRVIAPLLA